MRSIRAVPTSKSDKLDSASRIDYSRIYTVDHYVKVKDFGNVHEKDLKRLWKQWWIVWSKSEVSSDEEDADDHSEGQPPASDDEPEYLEWVTAKYAYNDPKMMKVQPGDRIGVTQIVTDDWWKGRNLRTNEVNLFPSNYVDRDAALS